MKSHHVKMGKRATRVWDYVQNRVAPGGAVPPFATIKRDLGFKSKTDVSDVFAAFMRRGLVEKRRITDPADPRHFEYRIVDAEHAP